MFRISTGYTSLKHLSLNFKHDGVVTHKTIDGTVYNDKCPLIFSNFWEYGENPPGNASKLEAHFNSSKHSFLVRSFLFCLSCFTIFFFFFSLLFSYKRKAIIYNFFSRSVKRLKAFFSNYSAEISFVGVELMTLGSGIIIVIEKTSWSYMDLMIWSFFLLMLLGCR